MQNSMTLRFSALSENESFARAAAGAFLARLDPTMGELAEIKTAVSEAVTNAIVHGYGGDGPRFVELTVSIEGRVAVVSVSDEGKGIADVAKAREPFFTTEPGTERSGMGFTVMEAFMDTLEVSSQQGRGTTVTMSRAIAGK